MLLVARIVTQSALARTESRGAHQREDSPAPGSKPGVINQVARTRGTAGSRVLRRCWWRAKWLRNDGTRHAAKSGAGPTTKDAGRWELFDVPFEQRTVRARRVALNPRSPAIPALAIRFSCINANACKECMLVNPPARPSTSAQRFIGVLVKPTLKLLPTRSWCANPATQYCATGRAFHAGLTSKFFGEA